MATAQDRASQAGLAGLYQVPMESSGEASVAAGQWAALAILACRVYLAGQSLRGYPDASAVQASTTEATR